MVRTEHPDTRERRHANERQPMLPLNAAYRVMNQLDLERETNNPLQLELLPPVQPDLFIDYTMPDGRLVDPSRRP